MPVTITLPRGTRPVRIAVMALALVGGFFTIRSGAAFFLATPATAEIALQIDPTNGDAMSTRADEWLKTVQMGDEAAKLSAFSRQALEQSPYNVIALRDIGIITAANDDEPGAERLLSLASRLSLRDYLTHAWLLDYRFRTGQVAASVREADIVLRQMPENWEIIMPALVALTNDPRVIDPLARALAAKPDWRGTFLYKLSEANPNPPETFALLQRLKALGSAASKEELDQYFVVAGQKTPVRTLYAQWVALLPSSAKGESAALLHDPDFAGLDAPPPFGWRLYPSEGVYAERGPGPGGMGSALFASFAGDKETVFANQELVLYPGHYRLSGRAFADDAIDKGTFRWSVICMTKEHQAQLGQAPITTIPGKLVSYAIEFDVPADCDQQGIALVGAAVGDSFDTPGLYVDGLQLKRLR
ncbi:MAG: hypothetical protein E7773_03795 [Sphingomonas sp.]|uniref:hypothetical protein n=1 Tax=Sphingomonas sp. TaxID=28214 RepID=UPI001220CC57|nr:hypothetical protein [Sphingomonas sp.]THD37170.1 MAG: hypothetical protein E7773_03795 [Sphingomonas sp.]